MASKKSKTRAHRRNRRLAKASKWRRQPKGSHVGHGTHLADHIHLPLKAPKKTREKKPKLVLEVGPEPASPFSRLSID
jgi:hypothetical protein